MFTTGNVAVLTVNLNFSGRPASSRLFVAVTVTSVVLVARPPYRRKRHHTAFHSDRGNGVLCRHCIRQSLTSWDPRMQLARQPRHRSGLPGRTFTTSPGQLPHHGRSPSGSIRPVRNGFIRHRRGLGNDRHRDGMRCGLGKAELSFHGKPFPVY